MSRRRRKLEEKYNKQIFQGFADGKTKEEILEDILKEEKKGFLGPVWIWLINSILILIIDNLFTKYKANEMK